jgi:hypothetical protein
MRICTSPLDGASGASTSLTPTGATTFLLDLWTRLNTTAADESGEGDCPSCERFDSGEALADRLVGW